jgi:hypothetical protein
MTCPEALRLRTDYENALRQCGRALFSGQQEAEKLAAYEARNEASSLLVTHQAGCALCRREKLQLLNRRLVR